MARRDVRAPVPTTYISNITIISTVVVISKEKERRDKGGHTAIAIVFALNIAIIIIVTVAVVVVLVIHDRRSAVSTGLQTTKNTALNRNRNVIVSSGPTCGGRGCLTRRPSNVHDTINPVAAAILVFDFGIRRHLLLLTVSSGTNMGNHHWSKLKMTRTIDLCRLMNLIIIATAVAINMPIPRGILNS